MHPKTTAKDFFLFLGVFIGLYVSSVSFLMLAFAIVEKVFPIIGNYYSDPSGTIRWGLAVMIIFFPAFIYLSYMVNKDLKANPEKKEIWIRRWTIFFTLFISGLTIAIDLATLIYRFLGAEDLTTKFFLKVILVLLVAIVVFRYYLYELKRDAKEYKQSAKIFIYVISAVVLATVIYGVVLIGSPFAQNARNLDQQRVNDLSNIQSQIVYVQWTNKGTVPASLMELNDQISGYMVPTDPETGLPYEYTVLSKNSFELCATFSASSTQDAGITRVSTPAPYPVNSIVDNWSHSAGRVCFDRTIDPTIYKVQSNPTTPTPKIY